MPASPAAPEAARGPPRGNWVWEQEPNPKIREAWQPILSADEMAELSPEGRAKIEILRLRRVGEARQTRDREWLESLEKADQEIFRAAMKRYVESSEPDRELGAKVRAGGSKGAAKSGSEKRKAVTELHQKIRAAAATITASRDRAARLANRFNRSPSQIRRILNAESPKRKARA